MKKRNLVFTLLFITIALFGVDGYVVNSNSQTLSKINLETGEVDNNFVTLGQYASSAPNKVVIVDGYALVVITYENSIQKIDLATGETVEYIALEDSALPNDITVAGGFAYVTGNGNNKLYKINIWDGLIEASVEVGLAPQGIQIIDDKIWVANTGFDISTYQYETGTISIVSLDMEILSTIEVGTNPANMVQIENDIFVVCTGNYSTEFGKLSVIDIENLQVTETIEIGGSVSSIATANNKLYMGNSWPAGVYVYDLTLNSIESTPDDNIFVGGNYVRVNAGNLAVVDAVDYVQNSVVRIYSLEDHSLSAEYTVAVGATDCKFDGEESEINEEEIVINSFELSNYPNPFNPSAAGRCPTTTIKFKINDSNNFTKVEIYNVKGQIVKTLINTKLNRGKYSVIWNGENYDGKNVTSGIYYYILNVDGKAVAGNKMILIK